MYNIFEKPWLLLIAAVVAYIIIYIIRSVKQGETKRRYLLIPVLIAASAFAIDVLVQTDQEQINSIIKTCVKATINEDPNAIDPIIAPDYKDSLHQGRDEIMIYCRAIFSEPAVEKFIKINQSIEVSSSKATALFKGYLFFDKKSRFYKELKPATVVQLELGLKKYSDKKWKINRVEILEIDNQAIDWDSLLDAAEW